MMLGDRFWMVVNMADFGVDGRYPLDVLPTASRPKYVHDNRPDADTELLRLAKENPDGEFYLLTATSYAHRLFASYAVRETIAGPYSGDQE